MSSVLAKSTNQPAGSGSAALTDRLLVNNYPRHVYLISVSILLMPSPTSYAGTERPINMPRSTNVVLFDPPHSVYKSSCVLVKLDHWLH